MQYKSGVFRIVGALGSRSVHTRPGRLFVFSGNCSLTCVGRVWRFQKILFPLATKCVDLPEPENMTWHANDLIMARLIETLPAPAVSVREDLYLALIEAIVSQQLSTRVADVIFARFRTLFDEVYPHADQVSDLTTEQLRSVGLSGQKAGYIRNIAGFHRAAPIVAADFANHTDEAVITHLTQIKGVGRWTVQMLLMFPMNRPDVFPVDDLGIRQSIIRLYGVTETGGELYKRLHAIAENWQPNRTLACKYLWKARESK